MTPGDLDQIREFLALLDEEVEGLSSVITSMKRDDQFLGDATRIWVEDIRMNRSKQPNDKADPS